MILHQDTYVILTHLPEHNIVITKWLSASCDLTEKLYKSIMLTNAEKIVASKAKKGLLDIVDFDYTISPALQEWTNEVIFPKYIQAGFVKGACVMSKDIFAQFSFEQTMEEKTGQIFTMKYFDDFETAKDWLIIA